jgi:Acetyltransferase (GNAT) domain
MASDRSHLCLYNTEAFNALNVSGNQRYHAIDFMSGNRLVGTLAGVIDGTTFTSGYSAGFGGPDFCRDGEQLEAIEGLLDHAVDALLDLGVHTIVIRAKPLHYSPCETYLQFALLRRGFKIDDGCLNFFLDLTRFDSGEKYMVALKSSTRSRLKPTLEIPHQWRRAKQDDEWRTGYSVLQNNRREIGVELSLSYEYVIRLRETFPDRIEMYLLELGDAVLAASLVYRISRFQSQVMYWGDHAQGAYPGVMNLMAFHTVCTGLKQGLRGIDLGPSAFFHKQNIGSVDFKANIGATSDMRCTYVLSL